MGERERKDNCYQRIVGLVRDGSEGLFAEQQISESLVIPSVVDQVHSQELVQLVHPTTHKKHTTIISRPFLYFSHKI